ncbi:hypothetical protein RAS1_39120 [Phycisphaerae bacterium RAS1]|nr:hypothetical protein RAS1_39120 [Phycisphaerae bacterium RAS1]
MAIQFTCVGCQQPIEVDDEHAGRAAACPYCRHVVTVPQASTLRRDEPVAARPLGEPPPVAGPDADELAALKLLELRESASREELRGAWRSKSEAWHPERAPEARKDEYYERYRALQAAFDCLSRAHNEGRLPRGTPPSPPLERSESGSLSPDRYAPIGPPPLHVGPPPDAASRAARTYGRRALVCSALVAVLISVLAVRWAIATVNHLPPSMDPAEMQQYVQKPEVQKAILLDLQNDKWFAGARVGGAFFGLVGVVLAIVSLRCGGRRSLAAIVSLVICAPVALCCMGDLVAIFVSSMMN